MLEFLFAGGQSTGNPGREAARYLLSGQGEGQGRLPASGSEGEQAYLSGEGLKAFAAELSRAQIRLAAPVEHTPAVQPIPSGGAPTLNREPDGQPDTSQVTGGGNTLSTATANDSGTRGNPLPEVPTDPAAPDGMAVPERADGVPLSTPHVEKPIAPAEGYSGRSGAEPAALAGPRGSSANFQSALLELMHEIASQPAREEAPSFEESAQPVETAASVPSSNPQAAPTADKWTPPTDEELLEFAQRLTEAADDEGFSLKEFLAFASGRPDQPPADGVVMTEKTAGSDSPPEPETQPVGDIQSNTTIQAPAANDRTDPVEAADAASDIDNDTVNETRQAADRDVPPLVFSGEAEKQEFISWVREKVLPAVSLVEYVKFAKAEQPDRAPVAGHASGKSDQSEENDEAKHERSPLTDARLAGVRTHSMAAAATAAPEAAPAPEAEGDAPPQMAVPTGEAAEALPAEPPPLPALVPEQILKAFELLASDEEGAKADEFSILPDAGAEAAALSQAGRADAALDALLAAIAEALAKLSGGSEAEEGTGAAEPAAATAQTTPTAEAVPAGDTQKNEVGTARASALARELSLMLESFPGREADTDLLKELLAQLGGAPEALEALEAQPAATPVSEGKDAQVPREGEPVPAQAVADERPVEPMQPPKVEPAEVFEALIGEIAAPPPEMPVPEATEAPAPEAVETVPVEAPKPEAPVYAVPRDEAPVEKISLKEALAIEIERLLARLETLAAELEDEREQAAVERAPVTGPAVGGEAVEAPRIEFAVAGTESLSKPENAETGSAEEGEEPLPLPTTEIGGKSRELIELLRQMLAVLQDESPRTDIAPAQTEAPAEPVANIEETYTKNTDEWVPAENAAGPGLVRNAGLQSAVEALQRLISAAEGRAIPASDPGEGGRPSPALAGIANHPAPQFEGAEPIQTTEAKATPVTAASGEVAEAVERETTVQTSPEKAIATGTGDKPAGEFPGQNGRPRPVGAIPAGEDVTRLKELLLKLGAEIENLPDETVQKQANVTAKPAVEAPVRTDVQQDQPVKPADSVKLEAAPARVEQAEPQPVRLLTEVVTALTTAARAVTTSRGEQTGEQEAQVRQAEQQSAEVAEVAGLLAEKITVLENSVRQRRDDAPARTRAQAEQAPVEARPVRRTIPLEQVFSKVKVTENAARVDGEQRPATETAQKPEIHSERPILVQQQKSEAPAADTLERRDFELPRQTETEAAKAEQTAPRSEAVKVEASERAAAEAPKVVPVERTDSPETILAEHRHDMPVQPVQPGALHARLEAAAARQAEAPLASNTALSPDQLVEQIHELRESLAPGKSRELRIRLNPPELGEVLILAQRQGESVSATIVARTEEAHRAISERLDHFRAQLAADGGELKAVDVRLDYRSADGRQAQGGNTGSQAFQHGSEGSERSLAERLEWTLASGGLKPPTGESEESGFAQVGSRQPRRGATVEFVA